MENEIKIHGDKNVIFAIVGNKSDLYEDEKVTEDEAKEYAYNNNTHCYLTSARNNVGINNMFEELGNLYLEPTFQEKLLHISWEIMKFARYKNKYCT